MKAFVLTFIFILLSYREIYAQNSSVVIREKFPNQQNSDVAGTWSSGTNIPSPGSFGGAGVSYTRNDTTFIYCINGDVDGTGGMGGNWGQFRVFNVTTNTWTNLPNYPQPRAWVSGAIIGTNIYSIGGITGDVWAVMTKTIQRYNITTNTWSIVDTMIYGTGSSGACGYQDSLMFVVGGVTGGNGTPIAAVQLYNQTSNKWRLATPLPQARANGWMWIKSDIIYYKLHRLNPSFGGAGEAKPYCC